MKDLFGSFLATGGIRLANFVTGILAARILLPEGRGELMILLLWPVLIADLGSLSLNTSGSYHIARKKFAAQEIWAASVLTAAVLSLILTAIYLVVIPFILTDQRPEVLIIAQYCALLIPLHLYATTLISLYQGAQAFAAFNFLRSMVHFCYLAYVVLFLLVVEHSLELFVFSFLVANLMPIGVAVWLAQKRKWISFMPVTEAVKSLLVYGCRLHVNVVLGVVNRRLDQIILSVALAATDLGLYVVAVSIEGLLFMIASTTELMLFPRIAEEDSESARHEVLGRYVRASFAMLVPAMIILLVFTPQFIELLFGKAYLPATLAAQILIITAVPFTLKTMLGAFMRGSNRMGIITKSEGLGVVVIVIALVTLVPAYGLIGAAIAQLLAFTIPTIYAAYMIRRETGLRLAPLFRFQRSDIQAFEEWIARRRGSGRT